MNYLMSKNWLSVLLLTCFLSGSIFTVVIYYIFDIRVNKSIVEEKVVYYNHMKEWVVVSTEPTSNSDYMEIKLERTFNGEIQEKRITVLINKLIREDKYTGKFYDTSIQYHIGDTINIP